METTFTLHLLLLSFYKVYAIFQIQTICMKQIFALFLCCHCIAWSVAQTKDCHFAQPVIKIDFGDDRNPQDFSLSQLKDNYRRVKSVCPDDGQFTFSSYTQDCFNGNWMSFYKDHTPGSVNGRMMLVNAAYQPATFFSVTLTGLKPATEYEFSTWLVNVCPGKEGCEPTPPQIRIVVVADGKPLSVFYTGAIPANGSVAWKRYAGTFKTPASYSGIIVVMDDLTTGGCGNDFAMDDIEVRECRIIQPDPPLAPKPKPVAVNPKTKVTTPRPVEKTATAQPVIRNKETAVVKKETTVKETSTAKTVVKPFTTVLPEPDVIRKRDNPVAQKISTPESEITIELYDNGEIDGDTVTIYHNNQLLVSRAGLSVKPVTVTIQVDKNNPQHELVMVANNLGSIPPNTSLMVVTTKDKRYEVFISSSEKKNAKVLIDLEE